MHINLPENAKHWIEIAEKFLETTQPWEVEAEMNEGKVPDEVDVERSLIGRASPRVSDDLEELEELAVR